jgi:hypothetical protein
MSDHGCLDWRNRSSNFLDRCIWRRDQQKIHVFCSVGKKIATANGCKHRPTNLRQRT